jgi:hypothetical protein
MIFVAFLLVGLIVVFGNMGKNKCDRAPSGKASRSRQL